MKYSPVSCRCEALRKQSIQAVVARHCEERSEEAIRRIPRRCLCEPAEGRRDNPQGGCLKTMFCLKYHYQAGS